MKAALRDLASELDIDLFGVCRADAEVHSDFFKRWLEAGFHGDMDYMSRHRRSVQSVMPNAESVVVIGVAYGRELPPEQPRVARYAHGRDYHKVLRAKLKRLAVTIQELDPSARSRACVDTAPLFERELAHMAGIGWFGKNSCLINSQRGSWFFIGVLLTTANIDPDQPAIGGCGTCRKCIDACPTGAIVQLEDRWTVDSRRCISYLTIEDRSDHEEDLHGWVYGCDVCQEVCPFNESRPSQPLRGLPVRDQDLAQSTAFPSLVELAALSEERWDDVTRGRATRRAKVEQWRRNARLNLRTVR